MNSIAIKSTDGESPQEERRSPQSKIPIPRVSAKDLIGANPSPDQTVILDDITALQVKPAYVPSDTNGAITIVEENLLPEERDLHEKAKVEIKRILTHKESVISPLRSLQVRGEESQSALETAIQSIEDETALRVAQVMGTLTEMMDMKRLNQILKLENDLAISAGLTDALTGLPNRRRLDLELTTIIEACCDKSIPISILMIDADDFKRVNDSEGHDMGDEVLKAVSQTATHNVRQTDVVGVGRKKDQRGSTTEKRANPLVARYGGEEFVVILPGANVEGARIAAERIRQAVEKLHSFGKSDYRAKVSIGAASLTPEQFEASAEDQSVDTDNREAMARFIESTVKGALLKKADEAMYVAKFRGKNQTVSFEKTKKQERTDAKRAKEQKR